VLETKTTLIPQSKPLLATADKEALALTALCVALVLAVVALTDSFRLMPDNPPIYDPDIYLSMAQDPTQLLSHVPPFEWRILTPLLVSWLHFLPALKGFFVVTVLSLYGCGWLLYKLCEVLAVPRPLWAIPLFFCCHYASVFLVQNYMIVDPACLFFIILACYALYTQRPFLYLVALGLGALNKETIIAVALAGVFFSFPQPTAKKRTLTAFLQARWWVFLGAGLTIAIIFGLRYLIKDTRYDWGTEITNIINLRLSGHLSRQLFSIFALSFGPLPLVLLYKPHQTLTWLWQQRTLALYFLLVVAQIVIASQNARLVVYGLVTVIPLALLKLDLIVNSRWYSKLGKLALNPSVTRQPVAGYTTGGSEPKSRQNKWQPIYVYGLVIAVQIIFYAVYWPHLLLWN
jgi:hypothetical protein